MYADAHHKSAAELGSPSTLVLRRRGLCLPQRCLRARLGLRMGVHTVCDPGAFGLHSNPGRSHLPEHVATYFLCLLSAQKPGSLAIVSLTVGRCGGWLASWHCRSSLALPLLALLVLGLQTPG